MSDWNRGGTRARNLSLVLLVALVLIVGAFIAGRVTSPTSTQAAAGAGPALETTASASPPWQGPSGLGGSADARDAGKGWSVPAASAKSGPAAVTPAGVPHGYTRTPDGAVLAAVNASIATNWMRYTYPDPWSALGLLVASQQVSPQAKGALAQEFSVVRFADPNAPVGQTAKPSPLPKAVSARPCGCGLAVLGGRIQSGTPATDQVVEVAVMSATFSATQTVTVAAQTLQMQWEGGDWKVRSVDPDVDVPTVTAKVPTGMPLPAETWRR